MRQEIVQSFEESVKAKVKPCQLCFDKNGFTFWYWRNLEWGITPNASTFIFIHSTGSFWGFIQMELREAEWRINVLMVLSES